MYYRGVVGNKRLPDRHPGARYRVPFTPFERGVPLFRVVPVHSAVSVPFDLGPSARAVRAGREVGRLQFACGGFAGVERVGVWALVPVQVGVRSRVRLVSRIGVKNGRGFGLISG